MSQLVGEFIELTLSNFTLTFLIVGFIVAVIVIAVRRRQKPDVSATLLNWYLIFAVGVTYGFNSIMHTVFGDMSAKMIGWQQSPFQAEVGFASVGLAIVGFMAARKTAPMSLKFAALVAPACFLWGAAGGHIVDIIVNHNYAPGNAGVILYTDIFVPVIGFILWGLALGSRRRSRRPGPTTSTPSMPAEG